MNAASPATQTFSESHSLYLTTAGGEMESTQPAAFGCLPFQRVAGQHFVSRPLPHKAPKLFLPFGSFAGLNSGRHSLQLVPCPGWLKISILLQKVGAIVQKSNIGTK